MRGDSWFTEEHENDAKFDAGAKKMQLLNFCLDMIENGRYMKFEIADNIEALKSGGNVWKSVAFKPTSFKVQQLKRCPASLKE